MNVKYPVNKKVASASSVAQVLREVLKAEDSLDQDKEHFWAIGLNAQNCIKYIDLVHLGALNCCPCAPMEVFRRACIAGVASIIVAHNHPSQYCQPSREDHVVTKRLKEAGKILGIKLLDHIIVGSTSYYSFNDDGALI